MCVWCKLGRDAAGGDHAALLLQVSEQQVQIDMLQAAVSDAVLLRQELTTEQRARQEALGRLVGLEVQLAQVRPVCVEGGL